MVERRVTAIVPAWEMGPELCLKRLAGWPSIAYSLAAGAQASQVDEVMLVACDEQVLALAERFDRVRPVRVPRDLTPPLASRTMFIKSLAGEAGPLGDLLVWLSPRAALRPQGLVAEALRIIDQRPQAVRVTSVTHPGTSLIGLRRINQEGELETFEGCDGRSLVFESTHIAVEYYPRPLDARGGVFPLPVDSQYALDLYSSQEWERAEWLIRRLGPRLVHPKGAPRPLPEQVDLLVMDFDGVLTDNRVFVDQDGRETAAAYRSDSIGLINLFEAGIPSLVISKETNPVVAARCRKMKVPYLQGIDDKATALRAELAGRRVNPANVVYLGNDVNDLPCFPIVGCAVVVADALPQALEAADLVLERPGGYGAVRELCDLLIERKQKTNGTGG